MLTSYPPEAQCQPWNRQGKKAMSKPPECLLGKADTKQSEPKHDPEHCRPTGAKTKPLRMKKSLRRREPGLCVNLRLRELPITGNTQAKQLTVKSKHSALESLPFTFGEVGPTACLREQYGQNMRPKQKRSFGERYGPQA